MPLTPSSVSTPSTVIPTSQLKLGRQRRSLRDALSQRDWASVKVLDESLMQSLRQASSDPNRDLSSLIKELKVVVTLYRDILNECDDVVKTAVDHNPL